MSAVLRLYPSVPINSRTALRTTTIPRGGGADGSEPLMVREGEAVGFSIHAMHRLNRLYGEDADNFRPERWDADEENAVDLGNIRWGYLPFGGGPRICLGRKSSLGASQYSHTSLTCLKKSLHCSKLGVSLCGYCRSSEHWSWTPETWTSQWVARNRRLLLFWQARMDVGSS